MAILTDVVKLLKLKIKSRDDNILDQYNRLFMTRVFLVVALACGISWYKDDMHCYIPKKMDQGDGFKHFISRTCWIQGLYVYRDLQTRNDESAFYGISKDIDHDGLLKGNLCATTQKLTRIKSKVCRPMKKAFFLQYQYMPFYFGFLALLYFLPYMMFKKLNHDLLKLQEKAKVKDCDATKIFKIYFNSGKGLEHHRQKLSLWSLSNCKILLVKLLYVLVNVYALLSLDCMLQGFFTAFGQRWLTWANQRHTVVKDYENTITFLTPANELLPPFGYCEIYTSSKDVKITKANRMKVICEISQHVLYQYALVLLWLLIVIGICVSLLGVLLAIWKKVVDNIGFRFRENTDEIEELYESLPAKQIDYLELIRTINLSLHGEILDLFLSKRNNETSRDVQRNTNDEQFEQVHENPQIGVENIPAKIVINDYVNIPQKRPPSYKENEAKSPATERKYTFHEQSEPVTDGKTNVAVRMAVQDYGSVMKEMAMKKNT